MLYSDRQALCEIKCPICLKREKSKKLLQVHEYKVHRQSRYRYLCPICHDTFTRPGNVRQHLMKSHGVARGDQGVIEKIQVQLPVLPQNAPDLAPLGSYIVLTT